MWKVISLIIRLCLKLWIHAMIHHCQPHRAYFLVVCHLLFWYEIALLLPNRNREGHEDSYKVVLLSFSDTAHFAFSSMTEILHQYRVTLLVHVSCTRNRIRYNFSSWSHMNSLFRTAYLVLEEWKSRYYIRPVSFRPDHICEERLLRCRTMISSLVALAVHTYYHWLHLGETPRSMGLGNFHC